MLLCIFGKEHGLHVENDVFVFCSNVLSQHSSSHRLIIHTLTSRVSFSIVQNEIHFCVFAQMNILRLKFPVRALIRLHMPKTHMTSRSIIK